MSVKPDAQPLKKSVVTMLPVINLSATNMTALHSLLCFVVEQSKNDKTSCAFHHVCPTVICKGLRNCNVKQDGDFCSSGGFHDSPNPEEYKNDPIAVHLMQWFTTKKEEASTKSRTAALWRNYIHYIEIV